MSGNSDRIKSTFTWKSAATGTTDSAVGRNTGNRRNKVFSGRRLGGDKREAHHNLWKNDSRISSAMMKAGALKDRSNKRGISCAEGEAITLAQQKDMVEYTRRHDTSKAVASSLAKAPADRTRNIAMGPVGSSKARKRVVKRAKMDVMKSGIHKDDLAAINSVLGREATTPISASDVESQRKLHIDATMRTSGKVKTVDETSGDSRAACSECHSQIISKLGK